MNTYKRVSLLLGTLLFSLGIACADEALPAPLKHSNGFLDFLQSHDPNYSAVIDGYFVLEARKLPNAIEVSRNYIDTNTPHGAQQLATLTALMKNALTADSRQGYFDTLQANRDSLDLNTKLALLSNLGMTLDGCYDYDAAEKSSYTSQDAVWAGLKKLSSRCGVCTDIHTFVADAAHALGFIDTGTHSGIWDQGVSSGPHEIAQLRDPKTREFYVVNYWSVLNTHQTTLTEAIDVSQRVMSPLSGVSYVQSTPTQNHIYQARTARWIKDILEQRSAFTPGQSLISFNLGNAQRDVALNLSQNWDIAPIGASVAIKAFATLNQYETAEGQFTVEAVGAAAQVKKDFELTPTSEIGIQATGTAGYLGVIAPTVVGSPFQDGSTYERDNPFYIAKVNLHARWNKFTASLEYETDSLDSRAPGDRSMPYMTTTASLAYKPKSWATITYARKFEKGHDDNTHENIDVDMAYDKISVVIDARVGKVYLYNKGELYLFEGVEKTSAIGVRDFFRARIPADYLGQFSVYFDLSQVVANPSKDPFYESQTHAVFGTEWTKPIIEKYLEIGGRLEYDVTGKLPYYAFEEKGQVTPELARAPGVRGMVWLHGAF